MEVAGDRHLPPTEYSARGLIDAVLLLLAGRPSKDHGERFLHLWGFDPPAMLAAGEALSRPGETSSRFNLDRRKRKKLFGLF